jgi:site-specific recombinase
VKIRAAPADAHYSDRMQGALPPDQFPDLATFGRELLPRGAQHRSVKQLHAALERCAPNAPLIERVSGLEALFAWLSSRRSVPALPAAGSEPAQLVRLRLLLHATEQLPAVRFRLAQCVHSVLAESVGGGLFGRLGLPTDRGFLAETLDRISRGLLPEPIDEQDLAQLLGRLFPSRVALGALAATPLEPLAQLIRLLGQRQHQADPWAPLLEHLTDACSLLALRISAAGLSDVIRARSPKVRLEASPFHRLPRALDLLLHDVRSYRAALAEPHREALRVRAQLEECHETIQRCRGVTEEVVRNLEHFGVSVDVVYRIELIDQSLDRLSLLLKQLEPYSEVGRATEVKALLVELVGLRLRDRKLSEIAHSNLHLLARKIIERAGHTGEHYITSSRREYVKMLASAGGGGVLTAGTAALKFAIGWAHLAPFAEGVLSACNYAGSFIVMQLLGFTLATKQPSMTAAALAGTLRDSAHDQDLSALVAMIARITRSQLAAALGNIGMVIPATLAFDALWRSRHEGAPFLSAETAGYVLSSLHPTQSGTIFYAALTGVLLWSSSIAAGWLENWAVYRRLPEAIAEHRYGRVLGRSTMRWLSRFLQRNIAGFGGNATLGTLLAMTPVMGKFFGLPLDVRHVTLSTGALTLAVSSLSFSSDTSHAIFAAALGIATIGCLNFGVSFALALAVALRAREAKRSDRLRLVLSVLATFFRSPLQFFLPPANDAATTVHGPASVAPPPVQ